MGIEVYKTEIMKAVIKEFLSRKLDKVYSKEIEEWKKYIREQKFNIKLDKQMKAEIKRFKKDLKKWTPKELEEFVIEGLDCLKKENCYNYSLAPRPA